MPADRLHGVQHGRVPLLLRVREAGPMELSGVERFYRETAYDGAIHATDRLLIAERDGAILGVHRLCDEHGVLVLRGMRVRVEHQRQGIGSAMLRFAGRLIGDRACYCIPYRHLASFYGQIGFREISPDQAPEFLQRRFENYRGRMNLDVVIMRCGLEGNAALRSSARR